MAERDELRKLRPPKAVLEIAARLESAGYETWCVGGAVRDALLELPHLDWDLATAATPEQVRAIFGARRTIPVGIEFGTVGVLDAAKTLHEVTTFRRDVRTDGRHAEVEFGASLDEDLARRDFTINAIAYSPKLERLHDPYGGRADLARGVVRAVGRAEDRMREDRLRVLRAIRFASRFDFEIDAETWAAMVASAPFLSRLSPERVKQELEKTMDQVARPSRAFARWREAGALQALVPSLRDVSDDTLAALDCMAMPGMNRRPNRHMHRLAQLFSGVPAAAGTLSSALVALRFSKLEMSWIVALVQQWQALGATIIAAVREKTDIPDAQVRRWVAQIGRLHLAGFFRMAGARLASEGHTKSDMAARLHALYKRALRAAFHDPVDLRDLAIDGDDLRHAGVPPGPRMGRVLRELLDWVLDDPARNTPEALLKRARTLAASVKEGET